MLKILLIMIFSITSVYIYAEDYKISAIEVDGIPESEIVFTNSVLTVFTSNILKNEEYNVYEKEIYAGFKNKFYKFNLRLIGENPEISSNIEFIQFNENNFVVFFISSKSGYGERGPNHRYYEPNLLVFSNEIYFINFSMSYSYDDGPYFNHFLNKYDEYLTIDFVSENQNRRLNKLLIYRDNKLIWEDRLSKGFSTQNIAIDNVNLRSQPNINARKIVTIPSGRYMFVTEVNPNIVTIDTIQDYWFKVAYSDGSMNYEGWVFGGYIRLLK